jgi:hypothetical protein
LEDVRARMHAIQENEIDQLRELSKFLEMETRFSEQYLDVLKDVKEDWIDEYAVIPYTTCRFLTPVQRNIGTRRRFKASPSPVHIRTFYPQQKPRVHKIPSVNAVTGDRVV